MSATRTPYRTPSREAYAEVSLSEFSREDIEQYLAHLDGERRGSDGEGGLYLTSEDLDRLATLELCGQRQFAAEWLLDFVGEHIGRNLR